MLKGESVFEEKCAILPHPQPSKSQAGHPMGGYFGIFATVAEIGLSSTA